MKNIFYAIDMGAPSQSGGFFCWKYKENEITSFNGAKGWNDCIYDLIENSEKNKIHLTIEAALWGMKERTKDSTEIWTRRFNYKDKMSIPNPWSERPWYTGAGASTGFMAQEFLRQLVERGLKNKVIVYESYISGMKKHGKRESESKPDPMFKISGASSHCIDAFEGLLLTLEENNQDISSLKKYISDGSWPSVRMDRIIYLDGEDFSLGIFRDQNLFDLKRKNILFTKRKFKFEK